MPPAESDQLSAEQSKQLRHWVRSYLDAEALAGAGDPGRVIVRRLNNVEYNNTIRDLTGIDLQPTRQFPPDSVAGEGFANTGDSLVMSPALLDKYLDAAREIAAHAVLLRDGLRFSPMTTQMEWTEELLTQIRAIHERHTELYQERDAANVTRIQWGTVNLASYIEALLRHRAELPADAATVERIAAEHKLNPQYLGKLARLLSHDKLTPLLADLQSQLKTAAVDGPIDGVQPIVDSIKLRQDQLFKLERVGENLGNGLTPVDPLTESQAFRLQMQQPATGDVARLSLVASDAGDGNQDDLVVWQNPRFESPGMAPLLLRDVRSYLTRLAAFREMTLAETTKYLAAVAESTTNKIDIADLADRDALDRDVLRAWIDLLNVQPAAEEFGYVSSRLGNIVMFVGNETAAKRGDEGIASYLRSRGHQVSLISPGGKSALEQYDIAMAHDVVIISESIGAADVRFDAEQSLKDVPRPILSFEPYMYDDAAWTGQAVFTDFGHTGMAAVKDLGLNRPIDSVFLSEIDHPLNLGLRGKVKIYEEPYRVAFGVPAGSAVVVATADAEGKAPAMFVYDGGDALVDGSIAPAARMGLFLGQGAALSAAHKPPGDFTNLTLIGRSLLGAAVEYALDPENVYQPGLRELVENNKHVRPIQTNQVKKLLATKTTKLYGHEAINGWVVAGVAPAIVANSSGADIRIPGHVRPHGVLVHPTTTHFIATGWKSPIDGLVRIDAGIVDQHPEGGNGQTWAVHLEVRGDRQQLGAGEFERGGSANRTYENIMVRKGDFVSLVIGPRDADWACDGTGINLVITDQSSRLRTWNLAADLSQDILAGNPHPDRYGNASVWHFFSDEVGKYEPTRAPLPKNSLLTRWRAAAFRGETELATQLAQQITTLLTKGPITKGPISNDSTGSTPAQDRQLYGQVRASTSPLFSRFDLKSLITREDLPLDGIRESQFGLAATEFHAAAADPAAGATDLVVPAPAVIDVEFPAGMVAGREFVVDAVLASPADAAEKSASEGTVQLQVVQHTRGTPLEGLDENLPVLSHKNSVGYHRSKAAYDDFRDLLPRMMCCLTLVPLDSVVTIVQLHREDEHLSRLLLDADERAKLERLWSELFFISQDALRVHESFPLILEFATQGDPEVGAEGKFERLEEPIRQRAEDFQQQMLDAEPKHLELLIDFTSRAYRRPLTDSEVADLKLLYQSLRNQEIAHDDALRAVLAAVFVSPEFLYRTEVPAAGEQAGSVSGWEFATRLSYFLWSTLPDDPLREAAESGTLANPEEILRQTGRMIRDQRVRSLATEFACQWLDLRNFDQHNEKNESQFPSFADLRDDMYEELIRFFTDLFQRDGSVLEILDADHTFVNAALASHYRLTGIEGDQWQRTDGMKKISRGGVLGMAALLSKQSGATRTSPVLRGNWVVETLLGEHLPDPPPTVPVLPDAVSREGLTVRELTEKHVSAAECAHCHVRIDPYGFALESFDAIGRFRERDFVDKPVDTRAELRDGTKFTGIDGLRTYLLNQRRDDFLRQFCRKLLGYSLGRPVQLSDEPLIADMLHNLGENDFRFSAAVETIVISEQFQNHRGMEATRVAND